MSPYLPGMSDRWTSDQSDLRRAVATLQQQMAQVASGSAPASPGDYAPPSLNGMVAWAYDHLAATSSTIMTAGTAFYIRVTLPTAAMATNIVTYLTSGGGSLTTNQCFAGLYDSGGNRLGVTADQSTHWVGVPQVQSMAIVGGPLSLAAGTYYVALLCNGTTGPSVLACNTLTNQAVMGQSAPRRFNKDGGGTTSLPATVTLSGLSNPNSAMWSGLS